MADVENFLYAKLLLTSVVLVYLAVQTTADNNKNDTEDEIIKPMITSGYRMFSSIYAQHTVSIRVLDEIKYHGDNHICGGAIVTKDRVITAAHCIRTSFGLIPAEALLIYAGSLLRTTITHEERIFNVSEAIVHPNYTTEPTYADVACLIIDGGIEEIPDSIMPVPMATKTPKAGLTCTALGWGRVFEFGPLPDEILYVDLHIWHEDQCRHIQQTMQRGVFCGGDLRDRGKGTCHGDSGGPLFCDGKLAGVVSYGIGCGWSEVAADFYTDVSYFADWIKYAAGFRTCANISLTILAYLALNF